MTADTLHAPRAILERPSAWIITDVWYDTEADAAPVYVQAGMPKDWNGPKPGDWVGIGQRPDGSREAFTQDKDGAVHDIGSLVDDVQPMGDQFKVSGRKLRSGYPAGAWDTNGRWEVDCEADNESMSGLLSGRVKGS